MFELEHDGAEQHIGAAVYLRHPHLMVQCRPGRSELVVQDRRDQRAHIVVSGPLREAGDRLGQFLAAPEFVRLFAHSRQYERPFGAAAIVRRQRTGQGESGNMHRMARKHRSDQPDLFAPSPEEAQARRWGNYELHEVEQFRRDMWAKVEMLRRAQTSPWPEPARALSEEVCFHGQARQWFEEEEAQRIRRAFVTEVLRLEPGHFWPLFIDEVAPDLWENVCRQMNQTDAPEPGPE